jgi:lipoyl(octanoyl) transferase
MADQIWVVRCGEVPYAYAREAQKALEAARHADEVPDVLLLLEHPPVYTKGRRTSEGELPMGESWYRMQGIDVCGTDRGGRVTYHGPGQLVGYPIVSLKPYGDDVHEYVRRMERVMIDSLGEHGVTAGCIEGLTGVWVEAAGARDEVPGATDLGMPSEGGTPGDTGRGAEDVAGGLLRKIGSIGVHVNRAITTHGFAVNVANDLQPFEWIVPCGIEACRMTSLTNELGSEQDVQEFATTVRDRFGEVYEREPVEVASARLAEMVDGTEALVNDLPARVP